MKITFEELQAYLHHTYGGRGQETGMFMKLVEEIGEVAEVLNMRSGRKAENCDDLQEALANELVDVIHYTVAIAAINGIDLNTTLIEKDRKAAMKYHHDTNLESFIQDRRMNGKEAQP